MTMKSPPFRPGDEASLERHSKGRSTVNLNVAISTSELHPAHLSTFNLTTSAFDEGLMMTCGVSLAGCKMPRGAEDRLPSCWDRPDGEMRSELWCWGLSRCGLQAGCKMLREAEGQAAQLLSHWRLQSRDLAAAQAVSREATVRADALQAVSDSGNLPGLLDEVCPPCWAIECILNASKHVHHGAHLLWHGLYILCCNEVIMMAHGLASSS